MKKIFVNIYLVHNWIRTNQLYDLRVILSITKSLFWTLIEKSTSLSIVKMMNHFIKTVSCGVKDVQE